MSLTKMYLPYTNWSDSENIFEHEKNKGKINKNKQTFENIFVTCKEYLHKYA